MKTKIVHRHFKGTSHQTEVIGPSNYFDFRFKVLDSPALAGSEVLSNLRVYCSFCQSQNFAKK